MKLSGLHKLRLPLATLLVALMVMMGLAVAQDANEPEATPAEPSSAPTAGLPDRLPEGDVEDADEADAIPEAVEAPDRPIDDSAAEDTTPSTDQPPPESQEPESVPLDPAALVAPSTILPIAEGPPQFRFESPFSLADCITILRAIIGGLPVSDGVASTPFEPASLKRGIEVVSNYLKARDDLHYNLVDYRWERVATDSVTSALIQPLRFTWEDSSMPTRVDAISLEALLGDVYLHSMMIFDDEGNLAADYKFDDTRLMRLRHSLPRREVFHLWRPTIVSRVELALSRYDPLESVFPQVNLHVGRTNKPEHGKATIYYLSRAEQQLAAGDLADARTELQHALAEMIAYNEVLRQRR